MKNDGDEEIRGKEKEKCSEEDRKKASLRGGDIDERYGRNES